MTPYRSRAVCSTIGTPSVNNLTVAYRILTLFFLLLFALYDYRHHKIRNAALLAFLPWCLLSVPLAAFHIPLLLALLDSILGFVSGFLLLFVIAMATGGIGGGDIKLVALLGIPFGASGLMGVLSLSCLAALLYFGCLKLCRKNRPCHLPFAPCLFVGSVVFSLLTLCPF